MKGECGMTNPKALEIAETQCRLRLGPRHAKPISDDAVLTIGYHSGSDKSVLLTRARAKELHEWLGTWLEHGWDGVKQEDGQSTADTIDHFRSIAIRYQIERDHARIDAAREVEAAIALIPAELRTADLAKVAAWQSENWARIEATSAELEKFRLAFIGFVHALEDAGKQVDPGRVLVELQKMLKRYNHPTPKLPDPVPDAPVFAPDNEQLSLFDGTDILAAA
jgi:hypothetical protein